MLIVFRSKAAGSITMFGDAGTALLKLMGQSGVTPGAMQGEAVGAALERLRAGLAGAPPEAVTNDENGQPRVSLAKRAVPLIEFLERAAQARAAVMWEKS
jgi:Domain of unknown function (DUF1840)